MPMFEVPFAYIAMTVAHGKRKIAPRTLVSSVMIDVPAVSDADAPLVLRWHRYRHRHAGNPADAGGHPPFDYRRFDGDLFTPVFYEYSGRPDHHVTLDEAIEAVSQGYRGRHNPLFAGEEFHRFPDDLRLRAEDLAGIAAIRESDEDKIAAAIREQASDLVSVDGQLFRRDPDSEPVYDLSHGYVRTKRLDSIKPEKRDIRTLFRVDQIAEVLDLAGLLDEDAARGRAEVDLDNPATYRGRFREFVEIFDPSCLRYRADQGPTLLAYAAQVVRYDKDKIGDAPVEAMIAYAGLRDVVKAEAGATAVCGMLEAYADTLPERDDDLVAHFGGSDRDQILRETAAFRISPVGDAEPTMQQGPRP
jgi:hypothetical protein